MTVFRGFSRSFLAPYYAKGDPFESLLSRSTYLTKYCRSESWTDTAMRVVAANIMADPNASQEEAEELFQLVWWMQGLPPGRGLWTGGVPGIPADARYNCWYATIRAIDDWCWLANSLMLGGGVGAGLNEIAQLGAVARNDGAHLTIVCDRVHPNHGEVQPNTPSHVIDAHHVADSREGWVQALRLALISAFAGTDATIDVTPVRARGERIRTFGGVACGPGPLVRMLRAVWAIVRGAAGRTLTSVDALDVTNHIGLCIKSGNVRRSALITLGDPNDQAFRDAKKNASEILSHRHTSNNSIAFRSWESIRRFDWRALVDDMAKYGEPGIANLPLVWQSDYRAKGVNPCGEQFLWDREACNLAEVFPSRIVGEDNRLRAFRLITRYAIRQRLAPLSDPMSDEVRRETMRIGVGIGGLCDFAWSPTSLRSYYAECRREANLYASELRVNAPLTVTTVKPSGTISLLNGSSPGVHAPYAPFYVRRVRLASNDPMAEALMNAGVAFEADAYDSTGHTLCFEFPVARAHASAYVVTESIDVQFARQVAVQQHYADNAVSATLSFRDDERDTLARCLAAYVPQLKSTSCLPKAHGYTQAPYEQIDEAEFVRRWSEIDHSSPLVHGGDMETDECAGGVCPVR